MIVLFFFIFNLDAAGVFLPSGEPAHRYEIIR